MEEIWKKDSIQIRNSEQCGENTGGMAAMPRGKLSKNEESYQKT